MPVNAPYTIYLYLNHHCTNSLSSLHIFVHHCTFCASLHTKTSPAAPSPWPWRVYRFRRHTGGLEGCTPTANSPSTLPGVDWSDQSGPGKIQSGPKCDCYFPKFPREVHFGMLLI